MSTERPVVTQAMIDAYDEYTHLTLDRRGFMEKLTKLAGSAGAAAAIAPLLAANKASAEIIAADDGRLDTKDVTFAGSKGEMKGYLARPKDASGKLGGVIVIHENRGLNPHSAMSPAAWRWKVSWRWRRISFRRSAARLRMKTRRATCSPISIRH